MEKQFKEEQVVVIIATGKESKVKAICKDSLNKRYLYILEDGTKYQEGQLKSVKGKVQTIPSIQPTPAPANTGKEKGKGKGKEQTPTLPAPANDQDNDQDVEITLEMLENLAEDREALLRIIEQKNLSDIDPEDYNEEELVKAISEELGLI